MSSIEPASTNAKLDAFLKAPGYTRTAQVQTTQALAREVTIRADSRFNVTADPL